MTDKKKHTNTFRIVNSILRINTITTTNETVNECTYKPKQYEIPAANAANCTMLTINS